MAHSDVHTSILQHTSTDHLIDYVTRNASDHSGTGTLLIRPDVRAEQGARFITTGNDTSNSRSSQDTPQSTSWTYVHDENNSFLICGEGVLKLFTRSKRSTISLLSTFPHVHSGPPCKHRTSCCRWHGCPDTASKFTGKEENGVAVQRNGLVRVYAACAFRQQRWWSFSHLSLGHDSSGHVFLGGPRQPRASPVSFYSR